MELNYLSFDTPEATVRAGSCGVCHGYLKVISLERDPQAEAVADDLATLALDELRDVRMTATGLRRNFAPMTETAFLTVIRGFWPENMEAAVMPGIGPVRHRRSR
ncbi:hypothetical protein CNECB9_4820031 [Cupriavidus necator]|uniref:FdhE C-terminal domain-containing protein n=1 Tax=Cupriavidus necator TaxID=106590 RepID=A0A1K0JKW7_CUPNE|nr:hypothetical protein CNECB9_4820031 [Cupriavidus necator]